MTRRSVSRRSAVFITQRANQFQKLPVSPCVRREQHIQSPGKVPTAQASVSGEARGGGAFSPLRCARPHLRWTPFSIAPAWTGQCQTHSRRKDGRKPRQSEGTELECRGKPGMESSCSRASVAGQIVADIGIVGLQDGAKRQRRSDGPPDGRCPGPEAPRSADAHVPQYSQRLRRPSRQHLPRILSGERRIAEQLQGPAPRWWELPVKKREGASEKGCTPAWRRPLPRA